MSAAIHIETQPSGRRCKCRCTLQRDHTLEEYEAFYAEELGQATVVAGQEDVSP